VTLLLATLIVTACRQTVSQETPTLEGSVKADPSPTAVAFPTLRPTQTPDLSSSQACIDCHSNKQQLIDTADQIEVQEVESSGEG
jgi:hypothetical protein